jgi:hypothetical protein
LLGRVPKNAIDRQRVLLNAALGHPQGDADILLCAPGQPERTLASQVKRVKVGMSQLRFSTPSKLQELRKAVRQTNLLAEMGFWKVFLYVITVVDSREQNFDQISRGEITYAGLSNDLKHKINVAVSNSTTSLRVGLAEIDLTQASDNSPFTLDASGAKLHRRATEVPQSEQLTSWISGVFSRGGSVMEYRYRYNWQSDTQLGFNSPLVVGMKFADLKTGQVYQVPSIGVAGPAERVGLNPPENAVRTIDAGQLSPEDLEELCERYKFEDSPLSLRKQEFGQLGSSNKTVTASLRGIGVTRGMYSVQWNLSLDNGKILSDGFSAKNYGEVPDARRVNSIDPGKPASSGVLGAGTKGEALTIWVPSCFARRISLATFSRVWPGSPIMEPVPTLNPKSSRSCRQRSF